MGMSDRYYTLLKNYDRLVQENEPGTENLINAIRERLVEEIRFRAA